MRVAMLAAVCVLAGCASDKLAATPPPGVDLSGHWKLNEADSDDAQRLMQSQLAAATANTGAAGQTGSGGSGGRRGGRGVGGFGTPGPGGPVMPSVAVLDDALSWPGKDLTLDQHGAAVSFVSGGNVRTCRLGEGKPHHRPNPSGNGGGGNAPPRGRDAPAHGRGDAPPPRCGWDESTLVVRSGEADEDHPPYEQRFSVSDDGSQLEEVVLFKSGRSAGFVASREWDRAPQK